jgi:Fe-S cluster assembly iron-binding protein IscA
MLRFTEQAIEHLLRLRAERGLAEAYGARLGRGSQDRGVSLTFVEQPQDGDRVLRDAALPVYVGRDVVRALHGATIDVATQEGRPRLRVARTPAMAASRS